MENKNKYIAKWHRNAELSGVVHTGGCIIILVMIVLFFIEKQLIFLILFVVSIFINLVSFLYSFYFGWNTTVFFNKEKVWQKIKGKRYEWRWEDVSCCDFKISKFLGMPVLIPPIIEIVTKTDYKKLTFSYNRRRVKILMNICSDEKIKDMIIRALDNKC